MHHKHYSRWAALLLLFLFAGCAAGPDEFSLLTWNVLFRNDDYQGVVRLIRQTEADVVCLQEVRPELEAVVRRELADAYPRMIFKARARDGLGYALLSRHPVPRVRHLPNPGRGPAALLALIAAPGGQVQVFNLHLTAPILHSRHWADSLQSYLLTAGIRRREIEQFWSQRDPDWPAIVAGDLNSLENEPAISYLRDECGLVDACRAIHPVLGEAQLTWGWERGGQQPLARIDYIFSAPRLPARRFAVHPAGGSDHRPLQVWLAWPPR